MCVRKRLALTAKRNPRGACSAQRGERRFLRKAIEAVVDFDRVEDRGVMVEPALLRQVVRIEVAAPVLVLPSRAPDAHPSKLGHRDQQSQAASQASIMKLCVRVCRPTQLPCPQTTSDVASCRLPRAQGDRYSYRSCMYTAAGGSAVGRSAVGSRRDDVAGELIFFRMLNRFSTPITLCLLLFATLASAQGQRGGGAAAGRAEAIPLDRRPHRRHEEDRRLLPALLG